MYFYYFLNYFCTILTLQILLCQHAPKRSTARNELKEVKTPWLLNGASRNYHSMIVYWSCKVIKSCNLWLMLDLWPLKYPCANKSPNLFLQECKQQHLDTKLKEVKTQWVIDGASSSYHDYCISHKVIKNCNFWLMLDLWPLKYPCAKEVKTPWELVGASNSGHSMIAYWLRQLTKSNILRFVLDLWPLKILVQHGPNFIFQKYKQQYWDKLNEVKSQWVLVGASNSGHSMIAYLLRQLTKSNIFWFVLELWPLKILAPTWTQIYFF